MNKKLTIASALVVASASFAALDDGIFQLWLGEEGNPQVHTGLDNGSETSGYWWAYNDKADGGKSEVQWPVNPGNDYDKTALDPIIEHCSGVCGTAVLDKGDLSYQPFVGIGFNIAGQEGGDGDPTSADATSWGGLCISYTSEANPNLELGLGSFDADIGYANPFAGLSKASSIQVKSLAWSDFKMPSWYKEATKITGPEAAKRLVAVKFKIQTSDGSYKFNIAAVGPYTATCPSTSIKAVRSASSAKAILSGRSLSIAGIKSAATAEVLNLQGQVVAKGSVDASSSLNLASLDAGVYMVRVAGKSVNFTNKIVLK
ncbi:T9SS type A sorting domain-containing protein [Fibrobacter sp.]|uniref:T9SS type A sorting domain-containing protein n=1 Tax=Fibrobacter sp. TaxID=35828 RepID=UPI00386A0417